MVAEKVGSRERVKIGEDGSRNERRGHLRVGFTGTWSLVSLAARIQRSKILGPFRIDSRDERRHDAGTKENI
jgi:hypothetical protein